MDMGAVEQQLAGNVPGGGLPLPQGPLAKQFIDLVSAEVKAKILPEIQDVAVPDLKSLRENITYARAVIDGLNITALIAAPGDIAQLVGNVAEMQRTQTYQAEQIQGVQDDVITAKSEAQQAWTKAVASDSLANLIMADIGPRPQGASPLWTYMREIIGANYAGQIGGVWAAIGPEHAPKGATSIWSHIAGYDPAKMAQIGGWPTTQGDNPFGNLWGGVASNYARVNLAWDDIGNRAQFDTGYYDERLQLRGPVTFREIDFELTPVVGGGGGGETIPGGGFGSQVGGQLIGFTPTLPTVPGGGTPTPTTPTVPTTPGIPTQGPSLQQFLGAGGKVGVRKASWKWSLRDIVSPDIPLWPNMGAVSRRMDDLANDIGALEQGTLTEAQRGDVLTATGEVSGAMTELKKHAGFDNLYQLVQHFFDVKSRVDANDMTGLTAWKTSINNWKTSTDTWKASVRQVPTSATALNTMLGGTLEERIASGVVSKFGDSFNDYLISTNLGLNSFSTSDFEAGGRLATFGSAIQESLNIAAPFLNPWSMIGTRPSIFESGQYSLWGAIDYLRDFFFDTVSTLRDRLNAIKPDIDTNRGLLDTNRASLFDWLFQKNYKYGVTFVGPKAYWAEGNGIFAFFRDIIATANEIQGEPHLTAIEAGSGVRVILGLFIDNLMADLESAMTGKMNDLTNISSYFGANSASLQSAITGLPSAT